MDKKFVQLPLNFESKHPQLLSVEEIFDTARQSLLDRLGEDRRIERKPANYNAKALGDYFSMWANTKPDGGIIVLGQENDGTWSGCSRIDQSHINDLERAGDVYCPEARFEIKRLQVYRRDHEEDFILLIRVHYRRDKLVKTVSGDAFIRSGESKRRLTNEEAHELEIEKGQVDFEQEPSGFKYPDDFDMDLIRQFVSNYETNRGLDVKHTVEEILAINHLGKIESEEFVPSNACALLFAVDPRTRFPGCKIRFLRFDGEQEGVGDRFNAVKDIWIDEGSIPRQIVAIDKVMDSQIREFNHLGQDGIFYTAPEFPKPAWYEAIVNACVHRSYNQKNMNVFVKMFDDRLVVESPGGFPPLVTPENIYDMHQPRNPHLMDAMFYLNFVKCAHEGTRRIRDSMNRMGLPKPEFEQKEIGYAIVRITLRNNIAVRKVWVDKDASAIIGAAISGTLDQNERRIINFLAEYKTISVSQVQRLTGKSWPASSKIVKGLKSKGILDDVRNPKRKERDPGARYVLRVPKTK